MSISIVDSAINTLGKHAWIARCALDVSRNGGELAYVLRNVTCAAIRATVAKMPTNGAAIKAPTNRVDAIECLAACVRALRNEGFVSTSGAVS